MWCDGQAYAKCVIATLLTFACARTTNETPPAPGAAAVQEPGATSKRETTRAPMLAKPPPLTLPTPTAAPPDRDTITWWRDKRCPEGTHFVSDTLGGTDKHWCANERNEEHGPWVEVLDGQVIATCGYRNAKRHGRCVEWTERRLTRDVSYDRGAFHGPHIVRTVTGEPWQEFHYEHGQLHGVQITWHQATRKSGWRSSGSGGLSTLPGASASTRPTR